MRTQAPSQHTKSSFYTPSYAASEAPSHHGSGTSELQPTLLRGPDSKRSSIRPRGSSSGRIQARLQLSSATHAKNPGTVSQHRPPGTPHKTARRPITENREPQSRQPNGKGSPKLDKHLGSPSRSALRGAWYAVDGMVYGTIAGTALVTSMMFPPAAPVVLLTAIGGAVIYGVTSKVMRKFVLNGRA